MRFHLIDRIDAWTPNVRIAGRKVTSAAEEFWLHTDRGTVMPPHLVLESLCQAGTWLVMLSTDHRRRAALLSVGEVWFGGDVRPGDVLRLDAEITSLSDDAAVLDGTVAAAAGGEQVVLRATGIMCALIEGARLDDPEATRRMAEQLMGAGAAR